MIISRTPLRMSFVGGGSDLGVYYRENGGAVLSTAVDKYIYVSVNRKFDNEIRLSYSKTENAKTVAEVEHKIVRHTLELLGIDGGVEITSVADIPSHGTGLGSSSCFAVGLLNVLHAYLGRHVSAAELGRLSCLIEIEKCLEPIGKQDQYASAYGGFNLIEFKPDESVVVSPIIMPPKLKAQLESEIVVFYTGKTRSASAILKDQAAGVASQAQKRQALDRMVRLAYDLAHDLQSGRLDTFGDILHENWRLKREMAAGVSSDDIDAWYEAGQRAGATGGKILGAGSGGFLMFHAPQERIADVRRALDFLRPVPFGFEPNGSQIIFYNPTSTFD
jgi:D-glycero-alpha-D-manno-heptose-7-phosphate kinase